MERSFDKLRLLRYVACGVFFLTMVSFMFHNHANAGPGYELYFDGSLVSGPDAIGYTYEQAKQNCQWNMMDKPNTAIRCVYNGRTFSERSSSDLQGKGYELYFNDVLVSGPDAIGYSYEQARQNCEWNMQTKPDISIRCVYNGAVFSEQN